MAGASMDYKRTAREIRRATYLTEGNTFWKLLIMTILVLIATSVAAFVSLRLVPVAGMLFLPMSGLSL